MATRTKAKPKTVEQTHTATLLRSGTRLTYLCDCGSGFDGPRAAENWETHVASARKRARR